MCYDIRVKLESALKRAIRYGDTELIKELEDRLKPYHDQEIYHVSGFAHPYLVIYTNTEPYQPRLSQWGLVPPWVKDEHQKQQIWNKTLNARGETIFEKPSFRISARSKRAVLFLDGFFEHHHYKVNSYPFYIQLKSKDPFPVACLWSEWKQNETDKSLITFAIVTTKANELMTRIHNNPKIPEPRMPLILPEEWTDKWLIEINDDLDQQALKELIAPYPDGELEAYTVRRLRGKNATGNVPEVVEPYAYEELEF